METNENENHEHTIRTYLNNILSYADALLSGEFGELTSVQADLVRVIIKNAVLMEKSIDGDAD